MTTRRRYRNSSRASPEYRPTEGGVEGSAPGGSRRKHRHGGLNRRIKRKVTAMVIGFAVFGVAGGLLTLLLAEKTQRLQGRVAVTTDDEAPLPAPVPKPTTPHSAVPVVTCPGTARSAQHPAYAAACGDSRALKAWLDRPEATTVTDPRKEFSGRTALHHAAQRGDTTMVAELLAAGADPNSADTAGHTPLHLIAVTPQLTNPEFVARRLLDGGARIDLRDARGLTPIQELEADHERLLAQPSLAQVLHQKEREERLTEWLTPVVPNGERPLILPAPEPTGESTVEVDTALGRVRIAVDPPAAPPQ